MFLLLEYDNQPDFSTLVKKKNSLGWIALHAWHKMTSDEHIMLI